MFSACPRIFGPTRCQSADHTGQAQHASRSVPGSQETLAPRVTRSRHTKRRGITGSEKVRQLAHAIDSQISRACSDSRRALYDLSLAA